MAEFTDEARAKRLKFRALLARKEMTVMTGGFSFDRSKFNRAVQAYRLAADSVVPLLLALVIAAVVVSLLASSFFLVPVAIWLAGLWCLIAPVIELEGLGALRGLRRSGRLVRGRWLKVASLIVVGGGLALVAGPLIGALLILVTGAPFWLATLMRINPLTYGVAALRWAFYGTVDAVGPGLPGPAASVAVTFAIAAAAFALDLLVMRGGRGRVE